MARLATDKVHMRCTATACRKRFKGLPYIEVCPECGKRAKADPWAKKKPWNDKPLCYCDGYSWSINGSPHRQGDGSCKFKVEDSHGPQESQPVDEAFGF